MFPVVKAYPVLDVGELLLRKGEYKCHGDRIFQARRLREYYRIEWVRRLVRKMSKRGHRSVRFGYHALPGVRNNCMMIKFSVREKGAS